MSRAKALGLVITVFAVAVVLAAAVEGLGIAPAKKQ